MRARIAWLSICIGSMMVFGCSSSSPDGGTGGVGGVFGEGNCVDDGACRSDEGERCTCRDCWPRDACEFLACFSDGLCTQAENCTCADCADEPECAPYCVPCSEFIRQLTPRPPFFATFPPKSALCEPESTARYDAFEQCACEDSCADECENSLCMQLAPSIGCVSCYAARCADELQSCGEDVRPDLLCNPVTGEPCRAGEACDRIQPYPGTVSGFLCFPPPSDQRLCDRCSVEGGLFCEGTLTCVGPGGGLAGANVCARYCCTDQDCGAGTCIKGTFAPAAPELGVCADAMGAIPGCEVADVPPSGGSCAQP